MERKEPSSFFYHGYRFDAGAALVDGFAPDMPLARLSHRFGIDWKLRPCKCIWPPAIPSRLGVSPYNGSRSDHGTLALTASLSGNDRNAPQKGCGI
jgi:hypothetical protein